MSFSAFCRQSSFMLSVTDVKEIEKWLETARDELDAGLSTTNSVKARGDWCSELLRWQREILWVYLLQYNRERGSWQRRYSVMKTIAVSLASCKLGLVSLEQQTCQKTVRGGHSRSSVTFIVAWILHEHTKNLGRNKVWASDQTMELINQLCCAVMKLWNNVLWTIPWQ